MDIRAFATIQELQQLLRAKKVSAAELVDYFIKRFERYDGKLESALEVFDKDSIVKTMDAQGPLYGIPGLIKNNICIQDRLTTCASRILENFRAPYDATAIARLKDAGAPILGTANLDEFAMGSSTETSYFKKTKNPWDTSRVPGGSSGGSAAAVAAGLVPWALGTETGGSVRHPAAFCGIVGLKPTYGRISRYGVIAYASSLDQVGILTRSVYDNALILSLIAGVDTNDSSCLQDTGQDYTKNLQPTLPAGLKIGVVDNALHAEGIDPEIAQAVEAGIAQFATLGATISRITLPALEYSAAAYFILSRAEAASNLARFDGVRYGFRKEHVENLRAMYEETRHDGFGPEVRKRILIGNYVLSAGHAGDFYENAQKVKRLIRSQFIDAFKEVDLLLLPSQSMVAFKMGAYDLDPLQIDLQDYFTCPMNLAGVPALSIPCGISKEKLPIGIQIVGPHCAEERIYQAAYAYEQATAWHTLHPAGY
jgi:aspartyl-tRNA(Asn)/glutamyl-tRNA(Gln) amidotransferase subunit A